ncbi:MAG: DUF6491 family protein [Woeseia sp.]
MKNKLFIKHIVAVLYASMILACASPGNDPGGADRDIDAGGSDCISIRTIRDYTPLDDRSLLIWGPAKRAYHVSLFRPAMELRSSFQLGFSSRDDQLCPFGGDGIVMGSFRQETISIQSITRLSTDQADELLIRHGRKEPAEQPAPAPEEVKGAEVEELG